MRPISSENINCRSSDLNPFLSEPLLTYLIDKYGFRNLRDWRYYAGVRHDKRLKYTKKYVYVGIMLLSTKYSK